MYEPFGPRFYEWWAGLSPLLRYGVAVLVLVLGAIVWYCDWGGPYFGGTLMAASVLLFLFAGRFMDN
jgi:hypothetical protein